MTDPEPFREYPKWRYHPKHGGRIFNSPEETKWHWLTRWRDEPFPSRAPRRPAREIWAEWKWLAELITALVAIGALLYPLLKPPDRKDVTQNHERDQEHR